MRVVLFMLMLVACACADPPRQTDAAPPRRAEPAKQPAKEPARELTTETLPGLRPGPGREHVIGNCCGCHSGAIIASNRLTRDAWNEVIDTMQKKHGMHALRGRVRRAILDYLEAVQRPDDPGLRLGKASPWATPLYRPNPFWK